MPARPTIRQLVAVALGNGLEFYDFLIFSFFATQIGATFFPGQDAYGRLLLALATFGVGFATRPLGGLVIGRVGDRAGRKTAMLLSLGLMGASIVGLALTPSYGRIGWAAPVLAVLFRLVQGFALGGEVGPATAFMIEAAPAAQRGFYVSLQNCTQYLAVLVSGLVGLSLSNAISNAALNDWGWRVAFLAGAAVVPIGYWLRRGLHETLVRDVAAPPPRAHRAAWRLGLLGLCMLACSTISTYVTNYMTTYAVATLHMSPRIAFGATVANGLCGMAAALLGGALSDRIGRKRVMIGGVLALLALVFPIYLTVSLWRTALVLAAGTGLMSALVACSASAILTMLAESLPIGVRSGGIGIIYALAIACFGGSAQFVVTWLIHVSGSALAPAWYLSGALLIGTAAMMLMRESAPARQRPSSG